MKILYEEEQTQEDKYRYTINQGGELGIKVSNGSNRYVIITFVNSKLTNVHYTFGDFDLRSNWHIYGAISEKIKELENRYCDSLLLKTTNNPPNL